MGVDNQQCSGVGAKASPGTVLAKIGYFLFKIWIKMEA